MLGLFSKILNTFPLNMGYEVLFLQVRFCLVSYKPRVYLSVNLRRKVLFMSKGKKRFQMSNNQLLGCGEDKKKNRKLNE